MLTLAEDFSPWWDMFKYQDQIIEARIFGDCEVIVRHASKRGWPGPEKDVEYWVTLDNGFAVGFHHPKVNDRRAKYAKFPLVELTAKCYNR